MPLPRRQLSKAGNAQIRTQKDLAFHTLGIDLKEIYFSPHVFAPDVRQCSYRYEIRASSTRRRGGLPRSPGRRRNVLVVFHDEQVQFVRRASDGHVEINIAWSRPGKPYYSACRLVLMPLQPRS